MDDFEKYMASQDWLTGHGAARRSLFLQCEICSLSFFYVSWL